MCGTLQREEALLRQGRMRTAESAGQQLCWNAAAFQVSYPSLANQLCIGGVYVRLLLDGLDQVSPMQNPPPPPPTPTPLPAPALQTPLTPLNTGVAHA